MIPRLQSIQYFSFDFCLVKRYNNSLICLIHLSYIFIMNLWHYLLFALMMLLIGAQRPFTIKDNKIYDWQGGMRIFHGVNLVEKVPPYYDTHFDEADMKKLKSWGINGIRLGVMWPGVEPEEGKFNQTYLDHMADLVQTAGSKYGIYTLVQFHQDLFSQKFCADGVPMWAIPKSVYESFPRPLSIKKAEFDKDTGLPIDVCGKFPWAQFYFSSSVNKAFGHLWKNKNGLLDKFANYWKKVAQTFKDSPYVIAYELMNEPWPGNLYENPLIMVPGLSEKFHLQQAYDRLATQIRKVDSNHNICFEPVTWLNNFESGFTHPPGGHRYANQSVFCYHYYNPPTLSLSKFMKARLNDVKRLNTGAILSEFYIINEEGQKNVDIMDMCDQYSHSWFGWIYNAGTGDQIVKQIRRTYAQRTAGNLISQQYDEESKDFTMSYYAHTATGNTIIVIDKTDNYPNGVHVECQPKKCQYNQIQEQQATYIKIASSQFIHGEMVGISITRL